MGRMTLLWAALISIATTLVMEWIAKPTLEARKERILEKHRTRRRIIAIALDESLRTEDYYIYQQSTSKPELNDEYRSLRAAMKPLRGQRNRTALAHMDDAVKGQTPRNVSPMEMSDIAYVAAQFLNEPAWHLRKRKALYAKLEEVVAKTKRR